MQDGGDKDGGGGARRGLDPGGEPRGTAASNGEIEINEKRNIRAGCAASSRGLGHSVSASYEVKIMPLETTG